jgi:tetratricopeptide (TPR) repeat protein
VLDQRATASRIEHDFRQAETAIAEGRPEAAASLLRNLIARGETRASGKLALLRLEQGKPEAAVRLLGPIATKPNANLTDLITLARAYRQLGRFDEARAVSVRILERQPNHIETRALLADLTALQNGPVAALPLYEQLQKLDPANPTWPRARGRLFVEIDRYESAVADFLQAARLAPGDIDLQFDLAEAEFLKGDPSASLSHLEEAARQRPDDARIGTARAECLLALGQTSEAVSALKDVLNREPLNARALRLLAGVFTQRQNHGRAVELLERARSADPGDWRVLYQLSLVYDRLGRHEEARLAADSMRDLQGRDTQPD